MAFRGSSYKPKSKKKKSTPFYSYTRLDMKRVAWCMNKKIHVATSPKGTDWQVEIRMNGGDWKPDPGTYDYDKAHEKMYEYYKYYYDKYNKQ